MPPVLGRRRSRRACCQEAETKRGGRLVAERVGGVGLWSAIYRNRGSQTELQMESRPWKEYYEMEDVSG